MSKVLPPLLLLTFLLFFSPSDSLLRLLFLLAPFLLYGIFRLGKRFLPPLSGLPPLAAWGLLLLLGTASLTLFHYRFPFLGGDEPHYVLMAQSLVEDGDLDLRNNYSPEKYAPFHPTRLEPHSHAALAELNSLMSAPPEKALPAPVSTIALIAGSATARRTPSTMPVLSAWPSPLTGGLSIVMTATSPCVA